MPSNSDVVALEKSESGEGMGPFSGTIRTRVEIGQVGLQTNLMGEVDMTKDWLDQQWDQLRQKYSAYLQLLETIPADRFHTRLVPGMSTPAELVVQISAAIVRDIAQGVAKGEIKTDESAEARIVANLGTKMAVIAFARKCWTLANEAVKRIGSAQLDATIATPWNMEVTGWLGLNILNDEFLHHYGQLYTYARLCGVEPPFLWGFAESTLQYRFAE